MSVIDHWDIARILLGIGLVACNVGVWRGVSLEYSNDESTKETGRRLLVRSLAVEALLAITLLTVDTTSSVLQKGEIAILYDRAAKAELELARMNAPRALNNKQMTDLINKLRPYAGKKYWIITQKSDETKISEPMNFSAQLSTAFTTAGWVKTNRSMKDQTKEDRAESKPDDRGCSVEFDFQESSRKLGAAVLAILNDVGVKCEENPDPDILPDFIILEIGLR